MFENIYIYIYIFYVEIEYKIVPSSKSVLSVLMLYVQRTCEDISSLKNSLF